MTNIADNIIPFLRRDDQALTILVVEDDRIERMFMEQQITDLGHGMVMAENGEQALAMLSAPSHGIDVILMDRMMPVMDGYQAMREIRRNPDWADLPIIALTARAMPEDVERCMAAGANDYMTKPVDIDRLLALLRVWLFQREEAA